MLIGLVFTFGEAHAAEVKTQLEAACVEAAKSIMRAPATFNLVGSRTGSLGNPNIVVADLLFDASNAYGVPLRTSLQCQFTRPDGSDRFTILRNALWNQRPVDAQQASAMLRTLAIWWPTAPEDIPNR